MKRDKRYTWSPPVYPFPSTMSRQSCCHTRLAGENTDGARKLAKAKSEGEWESENAIYIQPPTSSGSKREKKRRDGGTEGESEQNSERARGRGKVERGAEGEFARAFGRFSARAAGRLRSGIHSGVRQPRVRAMRHYPPLRRHWPAAEPMAARELSFLCWWWKFARSPPLRAPISPVLFSLSVPAARSFSSPSRFYRAHPTPSLLLSGERAQRGGKNEERGEFFSKALAPALANSPARELQPTGSGKSGFLLSCSLWRSETFSENREFR